MIKSIRLKMSMVFIVLIVSLQTILFVISAYFIEDIFIFGNKNMMIKMYSEYKSKTDKEYSKEDLINDISKEFAGKIILIDNGMAISNSNKPSHTLKFFEEVKDDIDKYLFFRYSPSNNKSNRNIEFITFIGKINKDEFIIFEKPLGDVAKSSDIAQQYIIISGAITIVLGSVIIFILSKRLTNPIISINKVAKDISNLNFTSKVKVDSHDELSILGDSINGISEKLNDTLNELKNANIKLQEDIEKERSLEKMRRSFVSSVSHELKTPISMIQGYADGLKFNIAKDDKDKEYYCDVIIDESKKMNCLIKDLLDLSSYESGIFNITKETLNLSDLISDICKKYKANLFSQNIKFILNLEQDCIVLADKLRIEQVVLNFLNNANKHVVKEGKIEISLKNREDYVHFSVYNDGYNIDDSEMENIWTSFYKSSSNTQTKDIGTGLGLAIVRSIMDLHNGEYGVENTENGVSFWINIPK